MHHRHRHNNPPVSSRSPCNLILTRNKSMEHLFKENEKQKTNLLDLLSKEEMLKVCAPMVRYSKLQFRNLINMYKCDFCYTPMILANSFCKSDKARHNEFTTNMVDTPVVTQFAASTVHDFVGAAYLVSPYCDGVDLNCGCPQSWAKQQGLGCAMLEKPQVIFDLVRQCRNKILKPFTVSVKMRVLKDAGKTLALARQLEMAGISFLAVHSRTPNQLTGDINIDILKMICENVHIPVIANGGIKTLGDGIKIKSATNCKGIMVANGLLTNPTLFTGSNVTSLECIQNWINICYNSTLTGDQYSKVLKNPNGILNIPEKPYNLTFQCFHHHLVFMLEKILPRKKRQLFNNLQAFHEVLDFLLKEFDIRPQLDSPEKYLKSKLLHTSYSNRIDVYNSLKPDEEINWEENSTYDYSICDGHFFKKKTEIECSDENWFNIFDL